MGNPFLEIDKGLRKNTLNRGLVGKVRLLCDSVKNIGDCAKVDIGGVSHKYLKVILSRSYTGEFESTQCDDGFSWIRRINTSQ